MSKYPAFFETLRTVENGIKKGWVESEQKWYPHESVEGGNPTIAYGHKLTDKEVIQKQFDDGITEQQALYLFEQDFNSAQTQARNEYHLFFDDWINIKQKYRLMLAEIVFNVGTLRNRQGKFGWPKLVEAMRKDDIAGINREYRRFVDIDGERKYLDNRVFALLESLNLRK